MKRVSASIPDSSYEKLKAFCDKEGRCISNLAAFILERGITEKCLVEEKLNQTLPSQLPPPERGGGLGG